MHSGQRFRWTFDRSARSSPLRPLAFLLVPSGASAQQKKLKVKVETKSQTQALNQGALKVSFKSKGLVEALGHRQGHPHRGLSAELRLEGDQEQRRATAPSACR